MAHRPRRRLLTEQGIDLYRQDFKHGPARLLAAADAPDRQGITEIRHVEGYLAYWDELRRRHPNMLIDSCASGGRRNDLETLRRAVPLLRSDLHPRARGQQGHTYGCAFWYPYFGTGVNSDDPYLSRSALCPTSPAADMRRTDVSYDGVRKRVAEWRATADLLFGDYWPLTPYSLGDDVDRLASSSAGLGCGMVQAFRRAGQHLRNARMPLRGLDRRRGIP